MPIGDFSVLKNFLTKTHSWKSQAELAVWISFPKTFGLHIHQNRIFWITTSGKMLHVYHKAEYTFFAAPSIIISRLLLLICWSYCCVVLRCVRRTRSERRGESEADSIPDSDVVRRLRQRSTVRHERPIWRVAAAASERAGHQLAAGGTAARRQTVRTHNGRQSAAGNATWRCSLIRSNKYTSSCRLCISSVPVSQCRVPRCF